MPITYVDEFLSVDINDIMSINRHANCEYAYLKLKDGSQIMLTLSTFVSLKNIIRDKEASPLVCYEYDTKSLKILLNKVTDDKHKEEKL